MRIRQVRPEFWTDPVVGQLPDSVRLFYVGLWNVADDAGWLDWQPDQIGALLYPYRAPVGRTKNILEWADQLARAKRLMLLECHCAVIPTLSKHQRVAGKQSFTVRDKHDVLHGKQSLLTDSPVEEGRVEERRVTHEGLSTNEEEWRGLGKKLRSVS